MGQSARSHGACRGRNNRVAWSERSRLGESQLLELLLPVAEKVLLGLKGVRAQAQFPGPPCPGRGATVCPLPIKTPCRPGRPGAWERPESHYRPWPRTTRVPAMGKRAARELDSTGVVKLERAPARNRLIRAPRPCPVPGMALPLA